MTDHANTWQVVPNRALGSITLGASLHNVINHLKSRPLGGSKLDVAYAETEPLLHPVVLTLPASGLRLRFDGPDQRLRLIEVIDFGKIHLTYNRSDILRRPKSSTNDDANDHHESVGPSFRHIYKSVFGLTYAGEYVPPDKASSDRYGTYVLSYPGVAFSFPLEHSAWSKHKDFVSILSSSAALPARSMAIFHGETWSKARPTLFTKQPAFPRFSALAGKDANHLPDEVEVVHAFGAGRLELIRRASPSFIITLSSTTPQDLVAELGPPDAIYRKHDDRIAIHGSQTNDEDDRPQSASSKGNVASPYGSYQDDSDVERRVTKDQEPDVQEYFYNYFHHGFDALISTAKDASPEFPGSTPRHRSMTDLTPRVTKIILHGNVPGSYPFNRHRRSRWM